MKIKLNSNEAKIIWKKIQEDLLVAQEKINLKFQTTSDPLAFLKFIESNLNVLNILDITYFDIKFGHYGKILKTQLLFPENGRLYLETAYYPLAKKYFGKRRIAISNKTVFANHYMQRLIQRNNISSIVDIKNALTDSLENFNESEFTKKMGGFDVSTAFINLHKDSISFGDLEIDDDKTCMAVMKTVLTANEISKKKQEMIDYILEKTQSKSCSLPTFDLPQTFVEADNIIEDTKNCTSGSPISWEEQEIMNNMQKGKFNKGKEINAFVCYLETYDVNSHKCKRF